MFDWHMGYSRIIRVAQLKSVSWSTQTEVYVKSRGMIYARLRKFASQPPLYCCSQSTLDCAAVTLMFSERVSQCVKQRELRGTNSVRPNEGHSVQLIHGVFVCTTSCKSNPIVTRYATRTENSSGKKSSARLYYLIWRC